jgi:hypothetical protein
LLVKPISGTATSGGRWRNERHIHVLKFLILIIRVIAEINMKSIKCLILGEIISQREWLGYGV